MRPLGAHNPEAMIGDYTVIFLYPALMDGRSEDGEL